MITLGTLGVIVFLFFPAPTVDPTPSPEDWGLGADAVHDPDLAPLRLTDIPPGIPFEPW